MYSATTPCQTLLFSLIIYSILIPQSHERNFKSRHDLLKYLEIYKSLNDQMNNPIKRNKTEIDLSLEVTSLDLNFGEGELKVDGLITLRWNDQRYKWNPEDFEDIDSIELPFSKVWSPEVILLNARVEKFIHRQIGIVKSNGDIIYLLSMHSSSNCKPNFEKYPFGIQTCALKFGSWRNQHYKVEYNAKNSTVADNDFVSTKGWAIQASSVNMESTQYPLFQEPLPSVVFNISFKKVFHFDPDTHTLLKVIN
ncbi:neuronal acetylcholine receptor subunit alpha-3 [Lepeophtheirus salmonis]|uniref:neuronal acetylcholine receptor subunit alpha-3 n=1 Tax=Lepeophtheirus salmonis TaxID=72036 RepID=UPI001AE1C154|nr:neuronal acetylcholine receptor subunit alpha-3-like [Lepeophtheirus salmonis]